MEDFTVIVGQLVAKINLTLKVNEIVGNKVYLCETLFLTKLKVIKDDQGNAYKVTDFMNNSWIELEPIGAAPNPFLSDTVVCPDLHYLHGTPSSVNDEYNQINVNTGAKMPMIWLNENYKEKIWGRGFSIERTVTPQLFFMDETNEANWTNEDHHRLAIQPQANLAAAFIKVVEEDRRFKSVESTEHTPRPRFGVYVEYKGNERKLIDDDLSGVEIQPTLVKYKTGCKC